MGTEIILRPSEIKFTQDSISDEFGRDTGETLEQTFKELLYGETDPEDIRPLTVVKYQNEYWVISGNRRLFIYRKLEELGRVEELTVNLRKYNRQRFFEMKTTKNEGASVRVRGKNNLEQRLNSIVKEWKRKGRPTSGLPAYHYGDIDFEPYYTASTVLYRDPSGSLRSSIRSTTSKASTPATSGSIRTNTSATASNLRTSTLATAGSIRTNTGSISSSGLLRSSIHSTTPRTSTLATVGSLRTSTSPTVGSPRTSIYQSSTTQPSIYRTGTYPSHDYSSSTYPRANFSYTSTSRSSTAHAMGDLERGTSAAQQPATTEKKDESWCTIL